MIETIEDNTDDMDTVFILKDNPLNGFSIMGHHKPGLIKNINLIKYSTILDDQQDKYTISELSRIMTPPKFFDNVEIYRIGNEPWILFIKDKRWSWLQLEGTILDEYDELYVNITVKEHNELIEIMVNIEFTFLHNNKFIHGPKSKLALSDLGM